MVYEKKRWTGIKRNCAVLQWQRYLQSDWRTLVPFRNRDYQFWILRASNTPTNMGLVGIFAAITYGLPSLNTEDWHFSQDIIFPSVFVQTLSVCNWIVHVSGDKYPADRCQRGISPQSLDWRSITSTPSRSRSDLNATGGFTFLPAGVAHEMNLESRCIRWPPQKLYIPWGRFDARPTGGLRRL